MTGRPDKPPLIDYDGRSAGATPVKQILIGAAIAVAGIALSVAGHCELPTDIAPSAIRLMDGILLPVAALGLGLAVSGVRLLRRERAFLAALSSASPDAWTLDRAWTPGHASDGAVAAGIRAGLCGAAGIVILTFFVFSLHSLCGLDGTGPAGLALAVATVIVAVALWKMYGPPVMAALDRGDTIVSWQGPTPIRLGSDWAGTAEVRIRLDAPKARLRFVVERLVTSGDTNFVRRQEAAMVPVQATASAREDGGTTVALRFKTENDDPSTAWSRYPSRYWELLLEDEKTGFAAALPLPLYP